MRDEEINSEEKQSDTNLWLHSNHQNTFIYITCKEYFLCKIPLCLFKTGQEGKEAWPLKWREARELNVHLQCLVAVGVLQWCEHCLNPVWVWWMKARDYSLTACTLLSKAESEWAVGLFNSIFCIKQKKKFSKIISGLWPHISSSSPLQMTKELRKIFFQVEKQQQ